jgi:hypothetical protein
MARILGPPQNVEKRPDTEVNSAFFHRIPAHNMICESSTTLLASAAAAQT